MNRLQAPATLAGKTLLVTRPRHQAGELVAALEAAGARALLCPLFEIVPVEDPAPLREAGERLEQYYLVFFVSANAVEAAWPLLLAGRPQGWPDTVLAATVGPGSARALVARGLCRVVVPRTGFDSEAVLALPEYAPGQVAGRRVLIVAGDGGRTLLADTLRARGAGVERVVAYHRRCPAALPSGVEAALAAGQVDALWLTSSEGVENLVRLVRAAGLAQWHRLPVRALHPRIVERARAAGFVDVALQDGGMFPPAGPVLQETS